LFIATSIGAAILAQYVRGFALATACIAYRKGFVGVVRAIEAGSAFCTARAVFFRTWRLETGLTLTAAGAAALATFDVACSSSGVTRGLIGLGGLAVGAFPAIVTTLGIDLLDKQHAGFAIAATALAANAAGLGRFNTPIRGNASTSAGIRFAALFSGARRGAPGRNRAGSGTWAANAAIGHRQAFGL